MHHSSRINIESDSEDLLLDGHGRSAQAESFPNEKRSIILRYDKRTQIHGERYRGLSPLRISS